MLFFKKVKDGGPTSNVDAYFLFEIKWLCSLALLKFNKGAREEYHTHAFNAFTWFLSGAMEEQTLLDVQHDKHLVKTTKYIKRLIPKFTPKTKNHRVRAFKTSWCLTVRGPWAETWTEHNISTNTVSTFTHGHKLVKTDVCYKPKF